MRKKKYEYVLENLENVEFTKGKAKFISENEIKIEGKIFNGGPLDEVIETLPVFPGFSESLKLAVISFKKDVSKLSCCI